MGKNDFNFDSDDELVEVPSDDDYDYSQHIAPANFNETSFSVWFAKPKYLEEEKQNPVFRGELDVPINNIQNPEEREVTELLLRDSEDEDEDADVKEADDDGDIDAVFNELIPRDEKERKRLARRVMWDNRKRGGALEGAQITKPRTVRKAELDESDGFSEGLSDGFDEWENIHAMLKPMKKKRAAPEAGPDGGPGGEGRNSMSVGSGGSGGSGRSGGSSVFRNEDFNIGEDLEEIARKDDALARALDALGCVSQDESDAGQDSDLEAAIAEKENGTQGAKDLFNQQVQKINNLIIKEKPAENLSTSPNQQQVLLQTNLSEKFLSEKDPIRPMFTPELKQALCQRYQYQPISSDESESHEDTDADDQCEAAGVARGNQADGNQGNGSQADGNQADGDQAADDSQTDGKKAGGKKGKKSKKDASGKKDGSSQKDAVGNKGTAGKAPKVDPMLKLYTRWDKERSALDETLESKRLERDARKNITAHVVTATGTTRKQTSNKPNALSPEMFM